MQEFDEFDAILKIRTGNGRVARLDCLRWRGRKVRVTVLWAIEPDDSRYPGEYACQVDDLNGERFPSSWLASGDLVRIN